MWCAACQTDVAGEISADGQRVCCASCGGDVSSVKTYSLHPKTREVRDLLERWTTEELLDPDLPVRPSSPPAPERRAKPEKVKPESEDAPLLHQSPVAEDHAQPKPRKASRPKFRLDAQHAPRAGSSKPVPGPHTHRPDESLPHTRWDDSHEDVSAPHFNIAAAFESRKTPGRGESLLGQILAYGGIGLLTIGTVLVLLGYFGGPERYTPTGWLLATAGQMLLFLGVVTLISGGMEQTTHEVARRIEVLGGHIIRIERHHHDHALKGPHFAGSEQRQRTRADLSVHPRDAGDE